MRAGRSRHPGPLSTPAFKTEDGLQPGHVQAGIERARGLGGEVLGTDRGNILNGKLLIAGAQSINDSRGKAVPTGLPVVCDVYQATGLGKPALEQAKV